MGIQLIGHLSSRQFAAHAHTWNEIFDRMYVPGRHTVHTQCSDRDLTLKNNYALFDCKCQNVIYAGGWETHCGSFDGIIYRIPDNCISLYLWRHGTQGHSCRIIYRPLHGEDRTVTRMPSVTIPMPACHRLDHEKHFINQKKWDPVDSLEPVGGPGLCGFAGKKNSTEMEAQKKMLKQGYIKQNSIHHVEKKLQNKSRLTPNCEFTIQMSRRVYSIDRRHVEVHRKHSFVVRQGNQHYLLEMHQTTAHIN